MLLSPFLKETHTIISNRWMSFSYVTACLTSSCYSEKEDDLHADIVWNSSVCLLSKPLCHVLTRKTFTPQYKNVFLLTGWAEGTWIRACVQTVEDKLNLRLSNCNCIAYFAFQSKDVFERSSRTGWDDSSVTKLIFKAIRVSIRAWVFTDAVLEGKSLKLKFSHILHNTLKFWPLICKQWSVLAMGNFHCSHLWTLIWVF